MESCEYLYINWTIRFFTYITHNLSQRNGRSSFMFCLEPIITLSEMLRTMYLYSYAIKEGVCFYGSWFN